MYHKPVVCDAFALVDPKKYEKYFFEHFRNLGAQVTFATIAAEDITTVPFYTMYERVSPLRIIITLTRETE